MTETSEPETQDAKPESRGRKWSRRAFISAGVAAGGVLAVGVLVRPGNPVDRLLPLVSQNADDALVNSWVLISPDNVITAITPHCEMGQGANSTLAQMLADEMDADWEKIQVMEAPATGDYVSTEAAREFVAPWSLGAPDWLEPTYQGAFKELAELADGMITGGSSSVRTTGQHGMRIAGAAAREMLVAAAAQQWNVPVSEITTENSMLSHAASDQTAPYAEFAALAAEQTLPRNPQLKSPNDYKLMGRPMKRTDIPEKTNGSTVFGIDAEIPDQALKYAAVLQPPVPGSRVESMDASRATQMPGVLQILNMGEFVAVVADGYWQAQQALNAISVEYSTTDDDGLDSAGLFERYATALDAAGDSGGDAAVDQGDVNGAITEAEDSFSAEYRVPFLAHAPLEPPVATAWVHDGIAEVWTSTQVPLRVRTNVSNALGYSASDVIIHNAFIGGSFGRRLVGDYEPMAARIAMATGYPVKMIFSREEDTQKSNYRPAETSRQRAGVDSNGAITGWDHLYVHREGPPEALDTTYYDIANIRSRSLGDVPGHLHLGSWRSVDASQHGFFTESFIDELAHRAGQDPFEYRRAMLGNAPRFRAVLETAAEMANWSSPADDGIGRGIALFRCFGTIVAEVAEVEMVDGRPRVRTVHCAADPGYAMNPDGFRAQMEGGIVFGLTAALYGEISLADGRVQQSNFHDYPMLRMNECPEIQVEIIDADHENLGGAGEPGVPPIAPAVTNAIFALTGERIRELPIAKHQFAVS
ncbi:xanthine dehydrogenase family protein molybdopterin-binding subunit [Parasphingopyxis sp. CP4]|uniref:xanthine dehydrogenase family protein molybdopterin-binding subunit n=1 Tax=Parasphingopyxis sp. CP4 TaxID=2724527 RepID=UPI0015A1769F|nr:molybdopterin cofactor-binding domain-containing protein [Parasphingopyxis sp. CP4]QLC22288.1 xanthine dehydrogenase family protein molybdopterin-binding subunit [Parasphingopyxis sp. CP4]